MLELEVETVGQRGLTEVSEMSGAYRFASRRHWGNTLLYTFCFFSASGNRPRERECMMYYAIPLMKRPAEQT